VTGVVKEPPLRQEGALEPVEHVVERGRELRDLVASALGDAPLKRGLADRPRRVRHRADGAQHAAGEPPREH
jgi:hypothetical protein